MYRYVSKAVCKPYRQFCWRCLHTAQSQLSRKHHFSLEIFSVGSGMNNAVTQNSGCGFDLDYNLVFQKIPEEYQRNPKAMKDCIRHVLDSVIAGKDVEHLDNSGKFSYGKDSKPAITYRLKLSDGKVPFSFDIGIISKNANGCYQRLVHDRHTSPDTLVWNEIPGTGSTVRKLKILINNHRRSLVRKHYLDLKNQYLRSDPDRTSFVIWTEAVNHAYDELCTKR